MMKSRLLLFVFIWFAAVGFGQTLVNESFGTSQFPPAGWTFDSHQGNWSLVTTVLSGGTARELKFGWSPVFNGYSRLVSPPLNTTGMTSLVLTFNQSLNCDRGTGAFIGVATRSSATAAWNVVYDDTVTADIPAEANVVVINTPDVGSHEFQFCLMIHGNSHGLSSWYIDNIRLSQAKSRDMAAGLLNTSYFCLGSATVKGTVYNTGNVPVTKVEIAWSADNGALHSGVFDGINVLPDEGYDFEFPAGMGLAAGDHELKVWVNAVNGAGADEYSGNDTLVHLIHVASQSVYHRVLAEEFASSTDTISPVFNSSFVNPMIPSHSGQLTVVKYPFYLPAPGDPYYIPDDLTRGLFYAMGSVPDFYMDGQQVDMDSTAAAEHFQSELNGPAFVKINAYHILNVSATDTTITVKADISSYMNAALTLYFAVVEKMTTGNAGTNGETQFFNVLMKAIPDINGTPIAVTDGGITSLQFSASLAQTHIEELNDIAVVVWVQDPMTRKVLQSGYSAASGAGINDHEGKPSLQVYPNPSAGKFFLKGDVKAEKLSVIDNMGKTVFTSGPLTTGELDLEMLPNGFYMLRIETRDGIITKPVSISR